MKNCGVARSASKQASATLGTRLRSAWFARIANHRQAAGTRLCYSALKTKQMGKSPLSNSNFKLQLISLLFTLFAANIYAATITGVVTRVSDGDTIQVSGVRCQESEIEESKNRKMQI